MVAGQMKCAIPWKGVGLYMGKVQKTSICGTDIYTTGLVRVVVIISGSSSSDKPISRGDKLAAQTLVDLNI